MLFLLILVVMMRFTKQAQGCNGCPSCPAHRSHITAFKSLDLAVTPSAHQQQSHFPDISERLPSITMKTKQKRARKNHLLKKHGSLCYWCRQDFPPSQLTLDHFKPRSRGGLNAVENLRLACFPCNNQRGNSLMKTKELPQVRQQQVSATPEAGSD
jgi:5-methylcytosine-specific restriction endonuclease McrA